MKQIGLLGGSFDPVHLAHTALAEHALGHLALDQVQLIPAADPWQRPALAASARQRLDMLELASRDLPGLVVNPVEIQRGGKTYTIDTLRQLPGDAHYYWLLGSDQLSNFCTWRAWEEITELAELVVAQRPGAALTPPEPLQHRLDALGRQLIELPFEAMAISATEIRRRLANDLKVDTFLDHRVAGYIQRHGLYRTPANPPDTL